MNPNCVGFELCWLLDMHDICMVRNLYITDWSSPSFLVAKSNSRSSHAEMQSDVDCSPVQKGKDKTCRFT
jgi:hypothetical protein